LLHLRRTADALLFQRNSARAGENEKNAILLSHVCIKMIILPRQARDKHRESTQQRTTVFPQILYPLSEAERKDKQEGVGGAPQSGGGDEDNDDDDDDEEEERQRWVRKTPLFEPFISKHDHFTKTGSGQTWGKHSKERDHAFCAGRPCAGGTDAGGWSRCEKRHFLRHFYIKCIF
jgi:hypothetical protein